MLPCTYLLEARIVGLRLSVSLSLSLSLSIYIHTYIYIYIYILPRTCLLEARLVGLRLSERRRHLVPRSRRREHQRPPPRYRTALPHSREQCPERVSLLALHPALGVPPHLPDLRIEDAEQTNEYGILFIVILFRECIDLELRNASLFLRSTRRLASRPTCRTYALKTRSKPMNTVFYS